MYTIITVAAFLIVIAFSYFLSYKFYNTDLRGFANKTRKKFYNGELSKDTYWDLRRARDANGKDYSNPNKTNIIPL